MRTGLVMDVKRGTYSDHELVRSFPSHSMDCMEQAGSGRNVRGTNRTEASCRQVAANGRQKGTHAR